MTNVDHLTLEHSNEGADLAARDDDLIFVST
jgi:hypothetical protein